MNTDEKRISMTKDLLTDIVDLRKKSITTQNNYPIEVVY
jgi:hypothetical protein